MNEQTNRAEAAAGQSTLTGVLAVDLKQVAMKAAEYAGIKPNDMVRFIVDYKNGTDAVEPCAAVMSFCERFAALLKAANV